MFSERLIIKFNLYIEINIFIINKINFSREAINFYLLTPFFYQ